MVKCALCGEEKELQLSHIIPKFVGKYLKKTSIGNIRSQQSPNKIIQDIEKHYMLCHDCEELFSASESYFANTLFFPYKKNKEHTFNYDKRLFFYITSLSWRSLYLDILDFVQEKNIKIDVLEKMIESEKLMREFLIFDKKEIGSIEHHMFFFDRIASIDSNDDCIMKKGNPHSTIHRSLVSYSGYTDNTVYTVSNLMGIIIVTLYSKDKDEIWDGTQVFNKEGTILARNQNIVSRIANEFALWTKQCDNALSELSNENKERILKRVIDLGERIKDFDIYQDILDDTNL